MCLTSCLSLWQMMGLNGRETLEKKYNLNNMKEKILQMYNGVIKS